MARNKPNQLAIALVALVLVISYGCSPEEGIGGNSSITGQLDAKLFSPGGALVAEYPALDERVYIIYGDKEIYDDETRSNHDGRFLFEYLYPGQYTIYAYSDCDSCLGGKAPTFIEVTLNKNEDLDIGSLVVRRE